MARLQHDGTMRFTRRCILEQRLAGDLGVSCQPGRGPGQGQAPRWDRSCRELGHGFGQVDGVLSLGVFSCVMCPPGPRGGSAGNLASHGMAAGAGVGVGCVGYNTRTPTPSGMCSITRNPRDCPTGSRRRLGGWHRARMPARPVRVQRHTADQEIGVSPGRVRYDRLVVEVPGSEGHADFAIALPRSGCDRSRYPRPRHRRCLLASSSSRSRF